MTGMDHQGCVEIKKGQRMYLVGPASGYVIVHVISGSIPPMSESRRVTCRR